MSDVLRVMLVSMLLLHSASGPAVVAQEVDEEEQVTNCDAAYNEQFTTWMAFLTGAGSQPSRPDANGSCFSELLQAQADAFSAWTSTQQSPPAAAPDETTSQPSTPAVRNVPAVTRVVSPEAFALTLSDMPPGFRPSPSSRLRDSPEGYAAYDAGFSLPAEQVLTFRGAFIVSSMIFSAPPDSIVGPERMQPIVAELVRDGLGDGGLRPSSGPQVGTNAEWFRGTMRSGDVTADVHAVVFRVADTVAAVSTVTLAGRGGQEDAVRYAEIVASRIRGAAVPAGQPSSIVPPSPPVASTDAAPAQRPPSSSSAQDASLSCSDSPRLRFLQGLELGASNTDIVQTRVSSLTTTTFAASPICAVETSDDYVAVFIYVSNTGNRADSVFGTLSLRDHRSRTYRHLSNREFPGYFSLVSRVEQYAGVQALLGGRPLLDHIDPIQPGRDGVVLLVFQVARDSQDLRLAAAR
jgi:hypothetical protein